MNAPDEKITARSNAVGSSNPSVNGMQVIVTVPERVVIKMIDSSALGEYEYHAAISAALLGMVMAFLVPSVQEVRSGSSLGMPFLLITLFLAILLLASFVRTMAKRKQVRKGGREIELQTTGAALT